MSVISEPTVEVSAEKSDAEIAKPNVVIVTEAGFIRDVISDRPDLLGDVAIIDATADSEGSDSGEVEITENSVYVATEAVTGFGRLVEVSEGEVGDAIRKLNEEAGIIG